MPGRAEMRAGVAVRWQQRATIKALLFRPRALLAALAFLLLIPCLGIPFHDQISLEQLHNRKLRSCPTTTQLISDPVEFFRHSREWLSDRTFPYQVGYAL